MYEFWLNNEPVSKKEFKEAYGEPYFLKLMAEMEDEPVWTTLELNGGNDLIVKF